MSETKPKPTSDALPADAVVENAHVLGKKKYTFQVLGTGGGHIEPMPVRDEAGNLVFVPALGPDNRPKVQDGKPVLRIQMADVIYGPRRDAGDIVETDKELDKIHNARGYPPKFLRLDKDHDPHAVALSDEKRRANALAADRRKLLEKMSFQQLREYAESEGIPVRGNTSKKDDLLRQIEAAQAELQAA